MQTHRNKKYIQHSVFLFCLLILVLNDHIFKHEYPNWFTGKLSDIAGIIMLPLVIAYLLPGIKRYAILISAVAFTFWKSPFSQGLIDVYNEVAFIEIVRVVDYSDLLVLLLLPIPYYMMKAADQGQANYSLKIHPVLIVVPVMVAFMATSPPRSYYFQRTERKMHCYGCYIKVPYSQDEIIRRLKEINIVFDSITTLDTFSIARWPRLERQDPHVYLMNQLVIGKDTLRNLDFAMRTLKNGKTKIYFRGMDVDKDVSDWEIQQALANYYKLLLFKTMQLQPEPHY